MRWLTAATYAHALTCASALTCTTLIGCRSNSSTPAGAATTATLPPACELVDRVFARYEDCRRAHPDRWPVAAVVEERHGARALYQTMPTAHAARMCSFEIDHLRVDMLLEDCDTTLTPDEHAVIAAARATLTPAPRGVDPARQPVVDAIAAARDAQCACPDRACVDAAQARVDALPLEQLQHEPRSVHDAVDAILSESYDCATHPRIVSPDRWAKVAP